MKQGLDEMIVQRERLMRCIERCQRQERLDEKVDPFMKRWGLKELTENMSNLPEEGDDESAAPGVVNSSASVTDGLNFTPKKMEHFITCECNPCVCAIDLDDEKAAEAAGATGLKVISVIPRKTEQRPLHAKSHFLNSFSNSPSRSSPCSRNFGQDSIARLWSFGSLLSGNWQCIETISS